VIDVIFPKRPPTPHGRGTRPIPSDYRPKEVRAEGVEGEVNYGDEPRQDTIDMPGINLLRLEDDLSRNRLSEIAALVRSLTYGEMMEFAHAIWKIRPDGAIDQNTLPMMLHMWSTASFGLTVSGAKLSESTSSDCSPAEA
jgi:hypothetical protein